MSALDAVRVAPATYPPGSISLRIRDRRSHALKEQVK